MRYLLKKAEIKEIPLRNYIIALVGKELNSLTEPCYYPSLKKNYYEILKLVGLSDNDLKLFANEFYMHTPAQNLKIHTQSTTSLILFIIYYFVTKKDMVGYNAAMVYFSLQQFTNLMYKQIRYCNPDAFKYALENVSKIHLFFRERSIPMSLTFLAKELQVKWTQRILEMDPNEIYMFLNELRSRISQSVKSFAEIYYRAMKQGLGAKTSKEELGDEDEKGTSKPQTQRGEERYADEFSKRICLYKEIDYKIVSEAQQLSGIKYALSTIITHKLSVLKYQDDVKLIITLFLRSILKDANLLCSKEYYTFLNKSMTVRRTVERIYLKQQVNMLAIKILQEIKEPNLDAYKHSVSMFLAYYITLQLRKNLCVS